MLYRCVVWSPVHCELFLCVAPRDPQRVLGDSLQTNKQGVVCNFSSCTRLYCQLGAFKFLSTILLCLFCIVLRFFLLFSGHHKHFLVVVSRVCQRVVRGSIHTNKQGAVHNLSSYTSTLSSLGVKSMLCSCFVRALPAGLSIASETNCRR